MQSANMMMPSKINDYAQIKLLNKGSFGNTYLAQSSHNETCVFKLFPVSKDNKVSVKSQIQLCVRQKNSNIVKVRQFFLYNQQSLLALVLEYCFDGNLINLIGQIDEKQTIKVITQIIGAIFCIHQKGLIHRNIKPQNILIVKGVPKITDFWLDTIMPTYTVSGIHTNTTRFYHAPQLLLNQDKYGQAADIWSLGIIFLELLLGQRIFKLVNGAIPPSVRDDFPSQSLFEEIKDKDLRDLVRMMLMKNPEERLSSEEVLDYLNKKTSNQQQVKTLTKIKKPNSKVLPKKDNKPSFVTNEQKSFYKFSLSHKSQLCLDFRKWIKLSNNNFSCTNPEWIGSFYLALVEGIIRKKDSSIRFKILKKGWNVYVGMGIKHLIAANSYQPKSFDKIGHGCFLLDQTGRSISHSHKNHNNIDTGFEYEEGNTIIVETNYNELWFRNQTSNKEFKMKIKLTQDQWKQACFCVLLFGNGSSISIQ